MLRIADRLHRIKPSPSSMAGQRARELRAAGRDIIGLTSGEPDFDTPEHIKEAACRALSRGQTKYTDVGGSPELKHAVTEKFRRENGLAFDRREIIVGAGGKQVIFNALMCTVEVGDEVVVPAPYWVSYPDIVRLAGGTPVFVACDAAGGFKLRPDDLERALTPRTRWLVLNAPNNPSGALYSRAELRALADVLLRHPQVWVMTDDVYEHIVYDRREFVTMAQAAPDLRDRTLTINGVSKAYAMTGWRIGYGGGPAELIEPMTKLQSQSTSNPCSIAQAAAVEALTGPQSFIEERTAAFQARRDRLVARLNAIPGIRCHVPEGAFYAFASCEHLLGTRTSDGREVADGDAFASYLLDAEGLAVLQGSAYGVPSHFRLSFATSIEKLDTGCDRLARACERLRG